MPRLGARICRERCSVDFTVPSLTPCVRAIFGDGHPQVVVQDGRLALGRGQPASARRTSTRSSATPLPGRAARSSRASRARRSAPRRRIPAPQVVPGGDRHPRGEVVDVLASFGAFPRLRERVLDGVLGGGAAAAQHRQAGDDARVVVDDERPDHGLGHSRGRGHSGLGLRRRVLDRLHARPAVSWCPEPIQLAPGSRGRCLRILDPRTREGGTRLVADSWNFLRSAAAGGREVTPGWV